MTKKLPRYMPANFPQPAPAPRPVRLGPATQNSLSPGDMACQMPDVFRVSLCYRRALQAEKLELEKVIPADLRTKVFERDAYRCVHCATHLSLTVDHIKPESKGGTLDFDNLQTLCRPCNSRKGVK